MAADLFLLMVMMLRNVFLLLSLWFCGSYGARFQGNVSLSSDWSVLAHFAIDLSSEGIVEGSVYTEHDSTLLLYNDVDDRSWTRLRNHHMATCSDASNLMDQGGYATHKVKLHGGQVDNKVSIKLPRHDKMTTWYVAISRCDTIHSVLSTILGGRRVLMPSSVQNKDKRYHKYHQARYQHYFYHSHHHLGSHVAPELAIGHTSIDLHMIGVDAGGSEFSADEVWLLPGTWFYFLIYIGLVSFAGFQIRRWKMRRDPLKGSMVLFYVITGITVAQFLSLFCSLVELSWFSSSGVERIDRISLWRLLSVLFDEISKISVVLLMVLLANGWMVLSPRIEDSDCVVNFGWFLLIIYLIATLGSFLISTNPNFTDEYHGVLWIIVLVMENTVLVYALLNVLYTLKCSDKLQSTSFHRNVNIAQAELRKHAIYVVGGLILFIIVQDVYVSVTSGRVDHVFLVTTTSHAIICIALLFTFRPDQIQLLHNTKAVQNKEQAWQTKAQEYGESFVGDDEDDDFAMLLEDPNAI